jgi:16S rRNA (guanine966-N2)-methyltransferase
MRVISGSARGRKLVTPEGSTTRPTPDRVREATFNALGSLGAVEGADVLDLFAGSGAMGIEALSRGAASATFVDSDARALAAIRANVQAAGVAERATVVRADVGRHLAGRAELGEHAGRVGLAILDPPYALADQGWAALLAVLRADVAVLESDRELALGHPWEIVRVRRYGTTVITLAASR